MTAAPESSVFATWLKRHPCTREELWKIQNMLGDCLPESDLYVAALAAWLDSSKHTFPDPHWDEGCIKCGGFDGEPCEPPETRLFTASDKKPEVPLSETLHIVGTMHRNELTQDDWDQVATAFDRLLADHARLIEAVEKKEGLKAFADLHFPPAA